MWTLLWAAIFSINLSIKFRIVLFWWRDDMYIRGAKIWKPSLSKNKFLYEYEQHSPNEHNSNIFLKKTIAILRKTKLETAQQSLKPQKVAVNFAVFQIRRRGHSTHKRFSFWSNKMNLHNCDISEQNTTFTSPKWPKTAQNVSNKPFHLDKQVYKHYPAIFILTIFAAKWTEIANNDLHVCKHSVTVVASMK